MRKFYKTVEIVEHPKSCELGDECFLPSEVAEGNRYVRNEVDFTNLSTALEDHCYYSIKLDGRVIKTMYKDELYIPSRALAAAMALEWDR